VVDGRVVGAGGIVPVVGEYVAFITLLDERYRIASVFYRLARRVVADAEARGLPRVVTMADMRVPRTREWLTRLGFRPAGPEFDCVPILSAAALQSFEVYTWQK
jgi:N-acetylglutamate synthase-like GNAT family acetyltransferase